MEEIKLPENIKIPEEDKEEPEEETEDKVGEAEGEKAEAESEPESIENIIEQPPATFIRRADAEQITPFLEAEPIENLEQDLQNVPGQTAQAPQTRENQEEQPEVYNAPLYSTYETREEQRPADPEIAGGALIRREEDMLSMGRPQERRIDFQRWQQTHGERGPEQQEKYIREAGRIKEEDKLPFQRKKKRLF